MRVNLPVTQKEHEFSENMVLMSATDNRGNIVAVNPAFEEVSGFPREELLGSPHNLVRHPDMPPEVFADLWRTLSDGDTWTGLIKNRRHNGDHYWVRANITPRVTHDKVSGYMSVRTRPSDDEVVEAQGLYRKLGIKGLTGWTLCKGIPVRTGWLAWTQWHRRMPLRWQLRLFHTLAFGVMAMAALSAGLYPDSLAIVMLGAFLALFTSCYLIEHQIALPIEEMLPHARAVAAGQAEGPLVMNRTDEIGMLARGISQAGLNQRALMAEADTGNRCRPEVFGSVSKS